MSDVYPALGPHEATCETRWHVLPLHDTRDGKRWQHYASPFCPCVPLNILVDGVWMWGHNAWDARERWERQGLPCEPGKHWHGVGEIVAPPGFVPDLPPGTWPGV